MTFVVLATEEPRTPKAGVRATRTNSRVAPRRVGAPHEHGQHLSHRVPSVAGSGFRSTGTFACVPRMNASTLATGRSACATRECEEDISAHWENWSYGKIGAIDMAAGGR
jgi:hypothetical protein